MNSSAPIADAGAEGAAPLAQDSGAGRAAPRVRTQQERVWHAIRIHGGQFTSAEIQEIAGARRPTVRKIIGQSRRAGFLRLVRHRGHAALFAFDRQRDPGPALPKFPRYPRHKASPGEPTK